MQRPIRELEALRPEQIDMNDPDIPETLKIRARNAMAREQREKAEAAERERQIMNQAAVYAAESAAHGFAGADRQETSP